MTQQVEELVLVASLLGVMVAMVATMVWWQRGKEARLAAAEPLSLPVDSTLRGVAVALPALCLVPAGVGLLAHFTDPWMRGHALAAVLGSTVGGLLALAGALLATARFRAIGALTLSSDALRLEFHGQDMRVVDLTQPFQLDEAWVTAPNGVPFQIVVVTGSQKVAFSYSLGMRGLKKVRGAQASAPLGPTFGGEARLLHERLTQRVAQVPRLG